jgi:hypothetical protein
MIDNLRQSNMVDDKSSDAMMLNVSVKGRMRPLSMTRQRPADCLHNATRQSSASTHTFSLPFHFKYFAFPVICFNARLALYPDMSTRRYIYFHDTPMRPLVFT